MAPCGGNPLTQHLPITLTGNYTLQAFQTSTTGRGRADNDRRRLAELATTGRGAGGSPPLVYGVSRSFCELARYGPTVKCPGRAPLTSAATTV